MHPPATTTAEEGDPSPRNRAGADGAREKGAGVGVNPSAHQECADEEEGQVAAPAQFKLTPPGRKNGGGGKGGESPPTTAR